VVLTEQTRSHLWSGKQKKMERTKGREDYEKIDFGQDAAVCVESYK